jgi:hypothetical protein
MPLFKERTPDLGFVGSVLGLSADVALEDVAGQRFLDGFLYAFAPAEIERGPVELGRDLMITPDEGQLFSEFSQQEPADTRGVRGVGLGARREEADADCLLIKDGVKPTFCSKR